MSKFKFSELHRYVIFFFLALFVIFFLGKNVQEDGSVTRGIKYNAVQDFKLGMDLAGGTRLTYALDFSSYRDLYEIEEEFQQFRRSTLQIVQRNIARRVDGLGLSDTNVFIRTLDNKDYLVVELGGVDNTQNAQEAIGRAVELQFKVPAGENSQVSEQRKNAARAGLEGLQNGDFDSVESLSNQISLTDTFFQKVVSQEITSLSQIYTENFERLSTMNIGDYNMFEGVYLVSLGQTFGSQGGLEILNGFTIFQLVDKEVVRSETINEQSFRFYAEQNELDVIEDYSLTEPAISSGDIQLNDRVVTLNEGLHFEGQEAYRVTFARIDKNIQDDGSFEETLFSENVQNVISQFELGNFLLEEENESISIVVRDSWITRADLESQIFGFDNPLRGINIFEEFDATFVVSIDEIKGTEQDLYRSLSLLLQDGNGDEDFIRNQMLEQTLYTIDELFIRDSEQRELAIDQQTNQVLNAAFFNFAEVSRSQTGQPVVIINFDQTGREIFCRLSESLIGQQMAIFVGESDSPVTAPVINERICGGQAQISGNFTPEEARQLARDLNDGAFPVSMNLESEEIVSPALGTNVLYGSLIAGLLGLVFIFVYLYFVYGLQKAFVGLMVLIMYLSYLLAVLKLPFIDYAFSLSGLAAIILALGMGIDANILIFERISEELENGKSGVKSAILTGVAKSRSSIKDGNISTGLIAGILFVSGLPMFTGFGTMILIMMLLVLLINVPLTKLLLLEFFKPKEK